MKIDYLARFDRAFKKLSPPIQREVKNAIEIFLDYLPQGIRPQGIGFRRLGGPIWEIRVGLHYRILLELEKDWITFVFVGNHDEVRRFLKNISRR